MIFVILFFLALAIYILNVAPYFLGLFILMLIIGAFQKDSVDTKH